MRSSNLDTILSQALANSCGVINFDASTGNSNFDLSSTYLVDSTKKCG